MLEAQHQEWRQLSHSTLNNIDVSIPPRAELRSTECAEPTPARRCQIQTTALGRKQIGPSMTGALAHLHTCALAHLRSYAHDPARHSQPPLSHPARRFLFSLSLMIDSMILTMLSLTVALINTSAMSLRRNIQNNES
jgi:hypothetical protein